MEAATQESAWKHSQQSVNGLSLHVVEAGPVEGPLLILLHGFPEFWWAWRHQITPFADQGYHVLAPDMRGYNQSDAPQQVSAYRLATLADDVLQLADRYGADRFCLAGHDWGGIVAWEVAIRHPQRLDRLVILDAPQLHHWVRQVVSHPTQLLRSAYAAFFQLPWLPERLLSRLHFLWLRRTLETSSRPDTFRKTDFERYRIAWSHPGSLTAMLNYYRALRNRDRSTERVRILCPTLILWGEKDSFLETHLATTALGRCVNGKLTIIENTTHWLHIEAPARVNAEIINFLKPLYSLSSKAVCPVVDS